MHFRRRGYARSPAELLEEGEYSLCPQPRRGRDARKVLGRFFLLAASGLAALALCLVVLGRERALRAVVARAAERLALEGEACVSSRELEAPSPLPFLLVGFSRGPNLLLLSPTLEETRGERRNVTIRVGRERGARRERPGRSFQS